MNALASSNGMASGIGVMRPACALTFSAKPPQPTEAVTRWPAFKCVTPGPTLSMIPATSPPGANGRSGLNWYLSSMMSVSGKFTPAALIATTTSPSPADGSGVSINCRDSGGPGFRLISAFIVHSNWRADAHCVVPTLMRAGAAAPWKILS
jgi:hypothetical protein